MLFFKTINCFSDNELNKKENESHYEFCVNNEWKTYIDTMIAIDYLILNRDRHGANIEVLRNGRKHTIRVAPLFDHGLSFVCSCYNDEEIEKFDITADKPCQNFIGSRSTWDNLNLIEEKRSIFKNTLNLLFIIFFLWYNYFVIYYEVLYEYD